MSSSKRIAINTLAIYGRSVVTLGLTLLSSRWILNALGADDFGLFQLVGSLIVFLAFFNSVMASSAARHFAFSIGTGDAEDLNLWFNASFLIHMLLPIPLIVIGWPIGVYFIKNVLVIPPDRLNECLIVFRISIIGAYVNMVSIPLIAMFTAKQKLVEIAVWGLLQSLLVFVLAYNLQKVNSKRLVTYAACMVSIQIAMNLCKMLRAFKMFPECKLRLRSGFSLKRIKELFRFAGWNIIGAFGVTIRDQGSAVLLNMYFGPALNAAFGIAKQVSVQVNRLSGAMMGSMVPEITSREGRGERAGMLSLTYKSSKYAFILISLFAVPILTEIDYILKVWLQNPPEYTAVFCKLILVTFIISRLTAGYAVAINAHGRMAGFHSTVGGLMLLTLPLAWGLFSLGYSPASLGFSFVIISVLVVLGCVYWIRKLFNEPVVYWVKGVLGPCLIVAAVSFSSAYSIHALMDEGLIRLIAITVVSILATILTTWFFALNDSERTLFRGGLSHIISKTKKS